MEIIKKKIKQKKILAEAISGITSGSLIIKSDPNAVYSFKILLTSNFIDLGFFDAVTNDAYSGSNEIGVTYVTGESTSRLIELEKFSQSTDILTKYRLSEDSSPETNGLDSISSVAGELYIYYLGGITFTDTIIDGVTTTTFSLPASGYTSTSFIDSPMIKGAGKENIVNDPLIENNVFITRQQVSVFENNYRLENINNISELEYYAGGGYFNIINNT